MAPIKVGFIGLSITSGWGQHAHLPYLKNSGKYEIVAICNSSVESSEAAIKEYNLSPSTKAYGDPEDIARDPSVELVVCSVRVDRHFATLSPSLKAGKNVFVEWPLGKSAAEARELLKLKNENGVKTAVVGLQARQAPIIRKLKDLVESGAIGKVLSSTWSAQGGIGGLATSLKYLGEKDVGGNLVTIHFGHAVDYLQAVLGYGFQDPKGLLANTRTHLKVVDKKGKVVEESFRKTADDTIFVQGTLTTGIPVSMTIYGGKPFPGTPDIDWRIYGEKAEIRVTAHGIFLQMSPPGMKIEVHDLETDKVEEVPIPKDELDGEPVADGFGGFAAGNVGRIYRGLASGEVNCSFEDAVERHEFLEELYKQNGYFQG